MTSHHPASCMGSVMGPMACAVCEERDSNHLRAATEMIGQGMKFERTRRITGYLVGSLDRFNNAKRAEEKDRVKHG